jgi:hypothetical protein
MTENNLKGAKPKVANSCTRYELKSYEKEAEVKDDANYVFIIDTSGSMSMIASYNATDPSKSKSILQVLVETINNKLQELASETPNAKVGIIIVNMIVTVLGDCAMSPRILDDDSVLNSLRKLKLNAKDIVEEFFETPISSSIGRIKETLKGLKEDGATALGPALVFGLELLETKRNGKLLVFTDGVSNVGIGNLTTENPEDKKTNEAYYTYWGAVAREQGTEVNFYTIMREEEPFDVDLYYQIVRDVNGSIFSVTPDQLINDISLPMEQSVLGRDAEVKIILPGALKFTAAVLKFSKTSTGFKEESKTVSLTNRLFTKKYGKLVPSSKELLYLIVDPNSMDRKEAEALKSLPIHLKLEWTGNDNKRHLLSLTQKFTVLHNKAKTANLEALKEIMKKCREERIRNNQQSVGVEEITDLMDNYLANPENEIARQLKKEAEETRENIKKSVSNKAVTVKVFTEPFVSKVTRKTTAPNIYPFILDSEISISY